MARIWLAVVGVVAGAIGAGFIIAGSAHWLALQYGNVAADFIVGVILFAVGSLIVAVVLVRPRAARPSEPAGVADTLAALPKHILRELSPEDLQGLALICHRRPMLAATVALALGLGVGLDYRRRKR